MELFIGFLLGVASTCTMLLGYGFYTVHKLKKAKKTIVDELRKKLDEQDGKRESIILRLKKAQAITEQQLDIRAATDQPSKNALHSRYKNGLISDIKKLEEEKIAILQSILDDGFDPTISVIDENGNRQELPLSHFVGKAASTVTPPEAPSPNAPKRVGKFVVVKGGKDDGTVH